MGLIQQLKQLKDYSPDILRTRMNISFE